MKKVFLSVFVLVALISSCKKNDDVNMKKNNDVKTEYAKDQKESFEAINTIHTSLKSKDKTGTELKAIYDTKLKSHIAVDVLHKGTKTQIAEQFGHFLESWGQSVVANTEAMKGKAGKVGKRYVNAKGVECDQLFKKGLIGAYQLSNALNEGQKAMAADANTEEILVNVTAYLLGDYKYLDMDKVEKENHGKKMMAYPVADGNEFGKYMNAVAGNPNFSTVADDLYNSLKSARKNLKNNQVFAGEILKALGHAQKIVAVRGVHYFLASADVFEDEAKFEKAIHGASEGLGFFYSLQFTYNIKGHKAYFSKEEVDEKMEELNFWDKTDAKTKLQMLAEEIATRFAFDANAAK